ncbi:hypothetical protein LINPERHAP2_LOCUS21800, partial [Linum perenne]
GDGGGDTDILETQLPSFDLGVEEDFGSASVPDESANDMGTDDLQMQEEEDLSFQETLGGYLKRKGLAAPKRPQRNRRPAAAIISPYTTGDGKRKTRLGKRMQII